MLLRPKIRFGIKRSTLNERLSFLENLYIGEKKARPNLDGLNFKMLRSHNAKMLEKVFIVEEIKKKGNF